MNVYQGPLYFFLTLELQFPFFFSMLPFSLFLSLSLPLFSPLFHMAARLVWTATFLPDSRQSRQLGAKCDKLSRIPREWRRRKIFTPRMPVGRSSSLSLYQPPWFTITIPRLSRPRSAAAFQASPTRRGLFQHASARGSFIRGPTIFT